MEPMEEPRAFSVRMGTKLINTSLGGGLKEEDSDVASADIHKGRRVPPPTFFAVLL